MKSEDYVYLDKVCKEYFEDVFSKVNYDLKGKLLCGICDTPRAIKYRGDQHYCVTEPDCGFTEIVRSELPRINIGTARLHMFKIICRDILNRSPKEYLKKLGSKFEQLNILEKKSVLDRFKIPFSCVIETCYDTFIHSLEVKPNEGAMAEITNILNGLSEYDGFALILLANNYVNTDLNNFITNLESNPKGRIKVVDLIDMLYKEC